jgi:hypothetical protein
MSVETLDLQTSSALVNNTTVRPENLGIRLFLNPRDVATVRSSDWVSASSGFQSNDQIRRIEIRSVSSFAPGIPPDSLLNAFFMAGLPGEPPQQMLAVDDFVKLFGRQSQRIDDAFILSLQGPLPDRLNRNQQFTINLIMSRGGILSGRTTQITFE